MQGLSLAQARVRLPRRLHLRPAPVQAEHGRMARPPRPWAPVSVPVPLGSGLETVSNQAVQSGVDTELAMGLRSSPMAVAVGGVAYGYCCRCCFSYYWSCCSPSVLRLLVRMELWSQLTIRKRILSTLNLYPAIRHINLRPLLLLLRTSRRIRLKSRLSQNGGVKKSCRRRKRQGPGKSSRYPSGPPWLLVPSRCISINRRSSSSDHGLSACTSACVIMAKARSRT